MFKWQVGPCFRHAFVYYHNPGFTRGPESSSTFPLCPQVTLLGVSRMMDKCIKGRKQQSRLNPRANYACFDDRHFQPFVVTTQPYEGLSHATLEWLKENQHLCDVLQVCCLTHSN